MSRRGIAGDPPATGGDAVGIPAASLREVTSDLLEAHGFVREDADQAADVLVAADLRGVDTHGVSNMLRKYIDWIASGHLNPRPAVTLLREAPSALSFDAGNGLGIALVPPIMARVIEKARQTGLAMASIHSGRHAGMLAYHAMLALPHDMIGVCATAVGPRMVPTFGREPRLGTNPLAVAAPAGVEPPFVYDASMTTVAHNKVNTARRLGKPLSPGWFAAPDGVPISRPVPATEDVDERMLPLGSFPETGSHKGYSLSCVVEVLSSVLSGGVFVAKLGPGFANHVVMAVHVEAFTDTTDFKREMDEFLVHLKTTPPAAGHERVLVAGQLEWETEQVRRENGIPLHPEVVRWLVDACDRCGIRPPANLQEVT